MADRRQKNANWIVADLEGAVPTWDHAQVAVLMDIRDELQDLNRLLHCDGFCEIPRSLDRIRLNTAKPRKRKGK